MPPTYHQFPIKCLACGLHYIVCSDFKDWPERHEAHYCPECGGSGTHLPDKLIWSDEVQGFIFQAVPGKAVGYGLTNEQRTRMRAMIAQSVQRVGRVCRAHPGNEVTPDAD